jgi:hypothetical protein
MAKRLAETVTIYTNGNQDIATTLRSAIQHNGYNIDSRPFARLGKGPSGALVKIHFQDCSSAEEGFLVRDLFSYYV